eukprot:UN11369
MKNRYYGMKAYALKIFSTCYHDKSQTLCRELFFISIFYIFLKSQGNY